MVSSLLRLYCTDIIFIVSLPTERVMLIQPNQMLGIVAVTENDKTTRFISLLSLDTLIMFMDPFQGAK